MKKLIVLSLVFGSGTTMLYAGGDILPTVFETEGIHVPVETYVPPAYIEPVVVPKVVPIPLPVTVLESITPLGLYVALGVTAARYDPNCGCPITGDVDKTGGLIGRIGYDFNEFFGLEARGLKTDWRSEGGDIEHYGIFLKPMYPVSQDINIYGLAGYAKTETPGVTRRKTNTESLAWGLGLEYDFGTDIPKEGKYGRTFDGYGDQESGWGLFTDYERLVQKSGSPDFDTINVGVTYDF